MGIETMKLSLFALTILSASAITIKKDAASIPNCNSSIRPKCVTDAVTAADPNLHESLRDMVTDPIRTANTSNIHRSDYPMDPVRAGPKPLALLQRHSDITIVPKG